MTNIQIRYAWRNWQERYVRIQTADMGRKLAIDGCRRWPRLCCATRWHIEGNADGATRGIWEKIFKKAAPYAFNIAAEA
jgi:hypothetical protein